SSAAGGAAGGGAPSDPALLAAQPVVWKVLIYDQTGQDIISPLIKVNELREQGITVHMNIATERQPILDVPAVYMLEPTPANIDALRRDMAKNLYECYYFNFTSAIPRHLIEALANAAVAAGAQARVAQVYDQYLNYICLDNDLVSLNVKHSYNVLNNPVSTETQIETAIGRIVDGVFSILVTLGEVPVLRFSKGGPAEMVARKLDALLRDQTMDTRSNVFADVVGDQARGKVWKMGRPVLILLDRNVDLSSLVSHSWTYAALIHDVLGLALNRVTVKETADAGPGAAAAAAAGRPAIKRFDIDTNVDYFWRKYAGQPFPQVAEAIDSEINKCKADVEALTASCGGKSLEQVQADSINADPNTQSTRQLKAAMEKLPELLERRRTLDMHMSIATALFGFIKDRKLDEFFELEQEAFASASALSSLFKQSSRSHQQLMRMLQDDAHDPEDKLRLYILFYLAADRIRPEDMAAAETALQQSGVPLAALEYIKQMKSVQKMASVAVGGGQTTPAAASASATNDVFGKFTSRLAGHLEGSGLDSLISGVKNLLPARKQLPLTRIVAGVMDGTGGSGSGSSGGGGSGGGGGSSSGGGGGGGGDVEDLLVLDPKTPRRTEPLTGGRAAVAARQVPQTFQDALVFMIGGGNYVEYQNLLEYSQR
ncbi:hypothetical protein CXG81DRAFT_4903, partial [Caulochytrium protostelioides]